MVVRVFDQVNLVVGCDVAQMVLTGDMIHQMVSDYIRRRHFATYNVVDAFLYMWLSKSLMK